MFLGIDRDTDQNTKADATLVIIFNVHYIYIYISFLCCLFIYSQLSLLDTCMAGYMYEQFDATVRFDTFFDVETSNSAAAAQRRF